MKHYPALYSWISEWPPYKECIALSIPTFQTEKEATYFLNKIRQDNKGYYVLRLVKEIPELIEER